MHTRAHVLAAHAHHHRCAPMPSEEKLWRALRSCQLGVRFRRQVALEGFIVDFFAPSAKLVVEVDGGYHQQRRQADARRDRKLLRAGYRVLRLEAAVVMRELQFALERIRAAVLQR